MEVSSFQGANNTHLFELGTWSSVLIREVSFKRGSTVSSRQVDYISSHVFKTNLFSQLPVSWQPPPSVF